MNDLDILRPEVREAVREIVLVAAASRTDLQHSSATIRAELLRLAGEVTELRAVCAATYQAAGCYGLPERFKDALSNAMHGEKLHDVDLDELLPVDPIDWVERAEKAEDELAALKARIAEAPMAVVQSAPGAIKASFHGYGCFEYMSENLQPRMRGKRVRLVVDEPAERGEE